MSADPLLCPECRTNRGDDLYDGLCQPCDRRVQDEQRADARAEREAREAAPPQDWLTGAPMDPAATPAERLPGLPGFPFLHAGAGAVIVGPTGGGRSSAVQAGLYDAALAGLRCAYLGCEVTQDEFDARAALIAQCRGDVVDDELRARLANVRYLDLPGTVEQAWCNPAAWAADAAAAFDLLVIDPASAVASGLDLDFDKSNSDWVRFYHRLVQAVTALGVTVVILDNVGHAADAKKRAKGASAKGDLADLSFHCTTSANPPGLRITADKVRSIRAPHRKGDSWLVVKETQRIEACEPDSGTEDAPYRPRNVMEKVSRAVEATAGLTANAIYTAVGGRRENARLALEIGRAHV